MEKFVFPESLGYVHKTIKVPRELSDKVQEIIGERKTTFSEFAVASIEYALRNLEIKNNL